MKIRIAALLLPLALVYSSAFADADSSKETSSYTHEATSGTTPAPHLALSTILQQLQAEGYICVKKINKKEGIYEIKVINQAGQQFKLKINPKTGVILNPPAASKISKITIQQTVITLEKAGYKNIEDIDSREGYYKVRLLDAEGNEINLKIDKTTGAISKDLLVAKK